MIAAHPRATMRLQLHKGFTFDDAKRVIPYIADLGISHVYSSPILTARPGSMHGYDVIDPTTVNPEIGGEAGLHSFVAAIRAANLGLIVDIVPNHMAVGGSDNPWWADVLQNGRGSRYASFFDIDWDNDDPKLHGKVLAPFLGQPYGDSLDAGDIKLVPGPSGQPIITYFDNVFPISPADYALVEQIGFDGFAVEAPNGRSRLHELLERQHYRLAWWGTAGDEINWRRFFDINGLAGLRIELSEVFEATHATLFRLYVEGLVDGFRIDHVDGLADPPAYCRRLRKRLTELAPRRPESAAKGQAYIVVEKILGAGEELARDWEVDGTSGYDFMNEVSAVQHNASGHQPLEKLWHDLAKRSATFEAEETMARREILDRGFDAQLRSVTSGLHGLARGDVHTRDITRPAIRRGLTELLAHFPVYRTYNAGEKRSEQDEIAFRSAREDAERSLSAADKPILERLDYWLGGVSAHDDAHRATQIRFQQLSAPIAAKAVEDTAFYRYGRLLSRNDVGFDAGRLGCSTDDFHQACLRRLLTFPDAMLATATHDHKRGEDLRARLAVISEVPDAWAELVTTCQAISAERPDPADEIMLYQMIVGAWPLDLEPADLNGCKAFADRLAGWQQKAVREAKLTSSWVAPNEHYERRAEEFLRQVMHPNGPFVPVIHAFIDRIAPAGAVNGLVQSALKMMVPGMPDFFQGTDFWDFSLVDPDNRRPVDYESRQAALASHVAALDLLTAWRDGRVKQAMTHAILTLRQNLPNVFARGDYQPLPVRGPQQQRFIAFARAAGNTALIAVMPRLPAGLRPNPNNLQLDESIIADSSIQVPPALQGFRWYSLFDRSATSASSEIGVADLLRHFPIAVLSSKEP